MTAVTEQAKPRGPAPLPAAGHLLLVEDSPSDALLIEEYLREVLGPSLDIRLVSRAASACNAIRRDRPYCVLLDLGLPDASGVEAVDDLQAIEPALPIVVITGTNDEELALAALQHGAQDYFVKDRLEPESLTRAIRYAVERKRMESELEKRTLFDPLTGLANRSLFGNHLRQAAARSARNGAPYAVMFVDIDGFKLVNDTHGHTVGDEVLREVARRLDSAVRGTDFTSRFGGDEFTVLCENLSGPRDAVRLAERIIEAVGRRPIKSGGHEFKVDLTIGIAFGRPEGGPDLTVREADTAMYRAKRDRARYALFDDAMHTDAENRLRVRELIRDALPSGRLELAYQPIVDLEEGRAFGVEALLRLSGEEHELSPSEFLPLADELGITSSIGTWVLDRACAQMAAWQKARRAPAVMFVNISPAEVGHPELLRTVSDCLARHDLTPDRLCIEITEGAILTEVPGGLPVLEALGETGVRIAIDDFGAGYASLGTVAQVPLAFLKIDRTIIEYLDSSPRKQRFLQGVGGFVRATKIIPIAEGVERREEVRALRGLGCVLAQGFLLARPAPPEAALRLDLTGLEET